MDPRPVTVPYAVMGVSGCGKWTVGEHLAEIADAAFIEGDGFHLEENIAKMAKGVPLTDEDRMPWLGRIGAEIKASLECGRNVVVSCSSLKLDYRGMLRVASGRKLAFVFGQGT